MNPKRLFPTAVCLFLLLAARPGVRADEGKIVREKIQSLAAGKMGYSTTQVGDMVAAAV